MLVVRANTAWSHVPQGAITTVQLSDGRVFTVVNNSGCREVRGVPDEDDVLFWKEWREYVDYIFDYHTPTPRERIAWESFRDYAVTRARRPEKVEAFEWALAYILANGDTPLSELTDKVVKLRELPRRLAREGAAQALRKARFYWPELFR